MYALDRWWQDGSQKHFYFSKGEGFILLKLLRFSSCHKNFL